MCHASALRAASAAACFSCSSFVRQEEKKRNKCEHNKLYNCNLCEQVQSAMSYVSYVASYHRRLEGWNTGTSPSPPRNRKNCCRNLVLSSKSLILATNIREIIEKSSFLLTFLSKFSLNFLNHLCFSSKRAKIEGLAFKFT